MQPFCKVLLPKHTLLAIFHLEISATLDEFDI